MTTISLTNATPTGPLPITARWPRRDHVTTTAHRRSTDLIGKVPGLRHVSTFPDVDLARPAMRRQEPGQPVTVSALLARIGGGR
ncbi:hypothetical protein [Pseudonocardia broussonetiae]|uniref:Uncharacterized protein n=1 Tax=Pseudonocardia broussonetiae TaxID=2736640 RepID=A0A6M6JFH1_9PSEU|nr:hypothetical protein [Pseudonocardia broussonetiae]QJY46694.1 hypothetical protein HOP40_13400 [Pseudonocardia broussonetiae]